MPAYAHATQTLVAGSKSTKGVGYTLHLHRRRSRDFGEQDFADRVTIDTLDDFAALTGRQTSIQQTVDVCNSIREAFPTLNDWLGRNSRTLHELHGRVQSLLDVTRAFVATPMPDCFLRELDVPVDTKFIEQNHRILRQWLDQVLPASAINVNETKFARRYGLRDGLPHHAIRFLDPKLMQIAGFPCDELSLPMRTLRELPIPPCRVIIVENRTNLLSVPTLDHTIGMGGVGDAVTRLQDIHWLSNCELYYWGDIDVDGFRILANLRRLFPGTISFLMDSTTYYCS